jgi:hypothetical protein
MLVSQSRLFGAQSKVKAGVFAAGALAFSAGLANAATITPTSATASSTFNNNTSYNGPQKSIDSSGLTGAGDDSTKSHTTSGYGGSTWTSGLLSADPTPTITFNLGSSLAVDAIYLWNFAAGYDSGSTNDVKTFDILSSSTGTAGSFTPVATGLTALAQQGTFPAQLISFGATTTNQFIQLKVTSIYAGGAPGTETEPGYRKCGLPRRSPNRHRFPCWPWAV